MRTRVAIIGGGPAGVLLSHMLDLQGIHSIVLERSTRAHVLRRIRAGVLEPWSAELLESVGLGERLKKKGAVHDGVLIAWSEGDRLLVDTRRYAGKPMIAYGQTAITEDLYAARDAVGGTIIDEAADVRVHQLTSAGPYVTYLKEGNECRIDCDYIVGCDGSRSACRQAIPKSVLRVYEKSYPFGWLGIMSETPPYPDICYLHHRRGFALASQRNPKLSRYYVQCSLDTNLNDWPDERFWEEFKARCPKTIADQIVVGPSIEKSIAPVRSMVAEPMSYGRLFLAGDAAHIVPPTGAKGLNLAVSDVFYLSRALIEAFRRGNTRYLEDYSDTALRRVWSATRLAWWLTALLHTFPDDTSFDEQLRVEQLNYLAGSEHAQASLVEQYVGLPF